MTMLLQLIGGMALLGAGRKLFWLFVGVVGFAAGLGAAQQFLKLDNEMLELGAAVAVGVAAAGLSLWLGRVVVAVAGFVAGGYVSLLLLGWLGVNIDPQWIPFIVGGMVGAALVAGLFDWALIGLSSLTGAALVVQAFDLQAPWGTLAFLGLALAGVATQTGWKRREGQRQGSKRK